MVQVKREVHDCLGSCTRIRGKRSRGSVNNSPYDVDSPNVAESLESVLDVVGGSVVGDAARVLRLEGEAETPSKDVPILSSIVKVNPCHNRHPGSWEEMARGVRLVSLTSTVSVKMLTLVAGVRELYGTI